MPLPRNAQLWLGGYVRGRVRGAASHPPTVARVWLTIADHFEPYRGNAPDSLARERVAVWHKTWPQIAARHRDARGCPPKYTFFYPQEEYRPWALDILAEMTHAGIADVEVHIHHGGEGEAEFLDRMRVFLRRLRAVHGLLREQDGRVVFAFIHGNWALDNSFPGGLYCGLNNEITLLRDLGCYADFTMPSAPSPTQSRMVNTIYWATDDPRLPRSFDTGTPVRPGENATGDLLMIPGPLGIRWKDRLLPRLEVGELAGQDPATPYRASRWLDLAPRVGDDLFLKLHTHGAWERNTGMLLEGGLDRTFALLGDECRRRGCELRFASAWEMRQAVDRAALAPVRPGQ